MKPFVRVMVAVPIFLWLVCACSNSGEEKQADFIQIGEFTVNRISDQRTEVRDGAGRTLVLIPRDVPAPDDVDPHRLVRTPVKRVVAYGFFDVAIMRALGVLEGTLVGVTYPAKRWYVDDVKKGMAAGKIAFLGDASSIDFERLKQLQPELVLTWDLAAIPMLDELGIPCAVTSTPTAMCLNARMRFVQFLAPFFNRQKEADAFFDRVNQALIAIRDRTAGCGSPPKVMWGDIYEKRVLVEPGNAWVGELIGLAESDYLFNDVYGTSCIEISVERFLYSGETADIFFTYRTRDSGATSKAALARMNPLLADIRPLKEGKVYVPLPHYVQSGDHLDDILTEIAAILHPEVYPDYRYRYFMELPDTDPQESGAPS
ncbi:ABC transporter substrate-binding protein [Desulfosarcina ovata subsp. sediminis]|uniref:ABC transporter substrate-binding protein n=1 Tax=Desulfosarcina ovata subsp. sediminis TaxID=885957 RepID=A0A5K7ZRS0_9BACT|nr:ABC transporter substrate-binding protein [Desulfosarcina ovata]BBO82593.1 ABC transporter substrate-binding protein [Desulfosarcina ovata subsp. sediminis]